MDCCRTNAGVIGAAGLEKEEVVRDGSLRLKLPVWEKRLVAWRCLEGGMR